MDKQTGDNMFNGTALLKGCGAALMLIIIVSCAHQMAEQDNATSSSSKESLDELLAQVKKNQNVQEAPNKTREAQLRERNSQRAIKRPSIQAQESLASPIVIAGSRHYHTSYPVVPNHPATRESYQAIEPSKVTRVTDQPVSTFSIDVDTGSYANVRRFLNSGSLPNSNAVRLEEMVNYFDYNYQMPADLARPFSINTGLIRTPWNNQTHLMRVAIKGWQQQVQNIPPMNLVFLVDVSGSMQSEDKLPLVVRSLKMLTKHLDENDRVAIVVYSGQSGLVLDSTPGNQKAKIVAALRNLRAGGSTNGEAGIELAYQIAKDNYIKDGVNRVMLATDGDFNVGISNRDELVKLIESKRDQGIYLNTLGFGTGNYNDYLMEQLADNGNGQYAYIDTIFEAKKVLVDEIASTMQTIAKDVKIQVEFNPQVVHEYRLLGYENRLLNEEDFNNDKVDAGEIGAGHTVTALYEVSLATDQFKRLGERRYQHQKVPQSTSSLTNPTDEIAWIKFRYKAPSENTSQEISQVLKIDSLKTEPPQVQDLYFAAAVAGFAQKLKSDKYLGDFDFDDIQKIASLNKNFDPYGRKAEFIQLVDKAKTLYLEQTD
ncbi:VWA domain-containing protein [Aliikangiella marina]|uniref:VWA domain-containing protein n=1 Tax=Aliikangiella marina TaxID=1712262 RepID=A0A545T955_9GAMM|nr:VWA domain-containing protein [Aliikangiella marina]TQV73753.1 VWA domain-containing protein [Aliikangiella marina]